MRNAEWEKGHHFLFRIPHSAFPYFFTNTE